MIEYWENIFFFSFLSVDRYRNGFLRWGKSFETVSESFETVSELFATEWTIWDSEWTIWDSEWTIWDSEWTFPDDELALWDSEWTPVRQELCHLATWSVKIQSSSTARFSRPVLTEFKRKKLWSNNVESLTLPLNSLHSRRVFPFVSSRRKLRKRNWDSQWNMMIIKSSFKFGAIFASFLRLRYDRD